jgi:hypothetical protein
LLDLRFDALDCDEDGGEEEVSVVMSAFIFFQCCRDELTP